MVTIVITDKNSTVQRIDMNGLAKTSILIFGVAQQVKKLCPIVSLNM